MADAWIHPLPPVRPGDVFISKDGQTFETLEELFDHEEEL
jgi:hypothetical protein